MSALATRVELDPIDVEIFAHRLWAIGAEGRIALQRVTASPIVAQGGDSDGLSRLFNRNDSRTVRYASVCFYSVHRGSRPTSQFCVESG